MWWLINLVRPHLSQWLLTLGWIVSSRCVRKSETMILTLQNIWLKLLDFDSCLVWFSVLQVEPASSAEGSPSYLSNENESTSFYESCDEGKRNQHVLLLLIMCCFLNFSFVSDPWNSLFQTVPFTLDDINVKQEVDDVEPQSDGSIVGVFFSTSCLAWLSLPLIFVSNCDCCRVQFLNLFY